MAKGESRFLLFEPVDPGLPTFQLNTCLGIFGSFQIVEHSFASRGFAR